MIIPKLKRSKRNREYNLYTPSQHASVVKAYLFNSMSHRQIDAIILELDDGYTRGYQSMGILHYFGLNNPFKGLFSGMSTQEAINELKQTNDPMYKELISILESFDS